MKKIFLCFALITLIFAFSITSFAYDYRDLPDIQDVWTEHPDLRYSIVSYENGEYKLFFFQNKAYFSSNSIATFNQDNDARVQYVEYTLNTTLNQWDFDYEGTNARSWNKADLIWTSKDIEGSTASFAHNPELFDGTPPDAPEDDSGWFSNIWESIKELPSNTAKKFEGLFDNLGNKILNGIKDIFVPDYADMQANIDEFCTDLKEKFQIDPSAFVDLFTEEKEINDVFVTIDIPNLGEMELKVLDTDFLKQGINYFRPLIRGCIVLWLFFYNVNQIIGFFGYNSGVIAGRSNEITQSLNEQGPALVRNKLKRSKK